MYIAAVMAACFINRQAIIVLAGMLCGELLYLLIDTNFWFCIAAGVLFAANGAVFIKLSSTIRQVLLLTGCLYWLGAVDDFLFPNTETMYYNSLSYIIGTMDLYVLLILLFGGRRLDGIPRGDTRYFLFCGLSSILRVLRPQLQKAGKD